MSESVKKKKDPSSRYTSYGVDARHFVLETVLNCFSPIEVPYTVFHQARKNQSPDVRVREEEEGPVEQIHFVRCRRST